MTCVTHIQWHTPYCQWLVLHTFSDTPHIVHYSPYTHSVTHLLLSMACFTHSLTHPILSMTAFTLHTSNIVMYMHWNTLNDPWSSPLPPVSATDQQGWTMVSPLLSVTLAVYGSHRPTGKNWGQAQSSNPPRESKVTDHYLGCHKVISSISIDLLLLMMVNWWWKSCPQA